MVHKATYLMNHFEVPASKALEGLDILEENYEKTSEIPNTGTLVRVFPSNVL